MRKQNSYIAFILVLIIASITVLSQIPIRLGLDRAYAVALYMAHNFFFFKKLPLQLVPLRKP